MSRVLAFGLLALAVAATVGLAPSGPARPSPAPGPSAEAARPALAGPRLSVDPASFDFGKALPGKALSKEFTVRNVGSAELVIEQVSTSCGCTAALLDTRALEPGASAALRVTLHTPGGPGPVSKSVLVRSNDPERRTTEIRIQATVVAARP